jgi:hypothetical protein
LKAAVSFVIARRVVFPTKQSPGADEEIASQKPLAMTGCYGNADSNGDNKIRVLPHNP